MSDSHNGCGVLTVVEFHLVLRDGATRLFGAFDCNEEGYSAAQELLAKCILNARPRHGYMIDSVENALQGMAKTFEMEVTAIPETSSVGPDLEKLTHAFRQLNHVERVLDLILDDWCPVSASDGRSSIFAEHDARLKLDLFAAEICAPDQIMPSMRLGGEA